MAVPLAIAAVSLEAFGQIQQGIVANQEAKYNAQVAEMRAEQARRAAEIQKYRIERRRRQLVGRQKALYAKAGVKFDEGSPLEVIADTAAQFDLEQAINKYNERTAVSRNMYEASFQRYAGKQRMTAGFMKAGGTILSGASQLRGSSPAYGTYDYWHSKGLASTPPYSINF